MIKACRSISKNCKFNNLNFGAMNNIFRIQRGVCEAETHSFELVCLQRVEQSLGWAVGGAPPMYLTRSPAIPFLVNYYPDGVGMSASESRRKPNGNRVKPVKKEKQDSDSGENLHLFDVVTSVRSLTFGCLPALQ